MSKGAGMFQSDYQTNSLNSFFYRVYAWMMAALFITAAVAYYVAATPAIYKPLFENQVLLLGIFIAQLALVIVLSAFLSRMSAATATILFILYAMSVGLTLSSIILVYTGASLFATFLVAAG